MENIFIQFILAACIAKQQELAALQAAAMIHHGYTSDLADEYHEYADGKYQAIKIGTAALFEFLDHCMVNIMVHYDLSPLDDDLAGFVEIAGMHVMANHPAVEILSQEEKAFARKHVQIKQLQSLH
jgi:hypothetical protein